MSDFPGQVLFVPSSYITPLDPLLSVGVTFGVSNVSQSSQVWPLANLAIYIPFVVGLPYLAVKMGVNNGTVVSGNVDVGIFDQGGNKIVTMGSTAQAGTSVQQVFDITDTLLLPGRYYMALACSNVTSTFICDKPIAALLSSMGMLQQATALPLPTTTATFAKLANPIMPMMTIMGRTVVT